MRYVPAVNDQSLMRPRFALVKAAGGLAAAAGMIATLWTAPPASATPAATAQVRPLDQPGPLTERYLGTEAGPGRAPASSSAHLRGRRGPGVRLFRCDEAPGGRCGIVKVRLDRSRHPGPKIPIFFHYYRHRDPGPTDEAIIATLGGPGGSATQEQVGFEDFTRSELFRPLLDTRDLIYLDQRGVGRSDAINCRRIQDGVPPSGNPYAEVRACGRHLGAASDLYSSDDVAKDINRVRAALGIEKLDFYGGSNAGVDVQAYAARFPGHLRSAVLDSPVSIPAVAAFGPFAFTVVDAIERAIGLICARSASCSEERADAMQSVGWLAQRLRQHPLDGVGHDAQGNPRHVHITEGFLLWQMLLPGDSGGFVSLSEIGAAADALRAGDETPLLRLAAEHKGLGLGDEGSPTEFSAGAYWARWCTDIEQAWDRTASIPTRRQQWRDAVDAIPSNAILPFSVDGWLVPFPVGQLAPDPCIVWPAPQHDVAPPIPDELPGDVPALILSADLDFGTPTAEALVLADEWPNSEFVELANAGHHTAVGPRFPCSHQIIRHFIARLEPGDTSCADDLDPIRWFAVGRFAVTVDDAEDADVIPGSADESTDADRRLGTVAANTVTDAFRRTYLGFSRRGLGLRGGTFTTTFGDGVDTVELDHTRFAKDAAVSGEVKYRWATSEALDATVAVDGPGGHDGTLRVKGVWFPFEATATVLTVRGALDGRQVRLQVPAT